MKLRYLEYIGLFLAGLISLQMGVDWLFTGESFSFYDVVSLVASVVFFWALYRIKNLHERIAVTVIINELRERPRQSVAQISLSTGISFVTIYTLMPELEREGYLTSEWEHINKDVRKPRRRLYTLAPSA